MIVDYLAFRPDSLTYTIAKALSFNHHEVKVRVADPALWQRELSNIQRRLLETARVSLSPADQSALIPTIDRLVVQIFPRLVEHGDLIARFASRARAVTLVTAGDRSRGWRQALRLQAKERRHLGRFLDMVDRVVYKDGPHAVDLYSLQKPRGVIGFDVHSQFLHDEELFRAIHARDWDPESRRPILVNFLGSLDPAARGEILGPLRTLLSPGGSQEFGQETEKTVFWHQYTDARPDVVDPSEFLRVLTQSDFTLCPPGYSLVTHRPMEALLRGSIPVLNAAEVGLYAIGLADGSNCVAVHNGDWPAALERLRTIDEPSITRMRRTIRSMLSDVLDYSISSKLMLARLGVTDQPTPDGTSGNAPPL